MRRDHPDEVRMTLEAFADTIVPGEKRSTDDRAIVGVAADAGAVAAGALELLSWSATGVSEDLGELARLLNEHARAYRTEYDLPDAGVPPFVGLPFGHRTTLVRRLLAPGHPEREFWVLLTLFSYMAYDSAAHRDTAGAVTAGHPGLTAMGIESPDDDGLWRFDEFSYGRPLAKLHPDTTPSGSPA